MSYAQRKQMSSNRTVAIIIVALIHVALGYALVTGLAYNVVKKAAEDLKTFDVEEEPPPPPDEPPPPPEADPRHAAAAVVAPPPIVRTNTAAAADHRRPRSLRRRMITPSRRRRRRPAAAGCAGSSRPQRAKGNLAGLFSNDDYPQSALRNEEQGTTGFRLDVGPDGRVTDCTVTASSGSSCARQRDLPHPAQPRPVHAGDQRPGAATSDSVHRSRIRWRFPRTNHF